MLGHTKSLQTLVTACRQGDTLMAAELVRRCGIKCVKDAINRFINPQDLSREQFLVAFDTLADAVDMVNQEREIQGIVAADTGSFPLAAA